MRTNRILLTMAAAGAVLATPIPASAHDPTPDVAPCDTTIRPGYQHGWDSTGPNDVDARPAAYVRNGTGQYIVRNEYFYVETVGGGGYTYPGAPDNGPLGMGGNQGGYIQFEVDPGPPIPVDADGHVGFYATGHWELCFNVAETRIEVPSPLP